MTCPLRGRVIVGIFDQAGSSGDVGSSPGANWDRMNIPSELTTGMPNHPRTDAPNNKPDTRGIKE
jgi:hypothetical protein